jgi:hypothetical protein
MGEDKSGREKFVQIVEKKYTEKLESARKNRACHPGGCLKSAVGREFELNVYDEKGPVLVEAKPIRDMYPFVRDLPDQST